MTPERRKLVTISLTLAVGMFVCAFFVLRNPPHRSAFTLFGFVLLLINSGLQYRYASRHRQPDTLIHLFPEPSPTPKERPIS
jgi:hypothetical protein